MDSTPRMGRVRRYPAIFLLMVASLAIGQDAHPAAYTIEIKQFKFVPDTLTVHPGDKITWKNLDAVPHTATSEGKGFDSHKLVNGQSWTLTVPAKTGEVPYVCTFHPNMRAKLIVK